jgi:predicted Zn-dependent protease
MKKMVFAFAAAATMMFTSCSKDGGGGFNIFSIQDDKNLGLQVKQEIANDPATYPVIPRSSNPSAYTYLEGIRNDILAAGSVTHKDDFAWEVYIIKDDNTQNAFCTPGGYIYVYTGLIKFLDDKSSLAGVIGHEMAHADKRHSTELLTKEYGLQFLLDIVLGKNQGAITQVLSGLTTLSFSRANETEADKYSVVYLCSSRYQADGAANFFQKILDIGAPNPPAFLSTHPNPDNRVQNIRSEATTEGCVTEIDQNENINSYTTFKNSL